MPAVVELSNTARVDRKNKNESIEETNSIVASFQIVLLCLLCLLDVANGKYVVNLELPVQFSYNH